MSRQTIDPVPLSGALGAEIRGIDLLAATDDEWSEIETAFRDHLVIAFPGQTLSPTGLVTVAGRFGTVGFYPFAEGLAEAPHVAGRVRWIARMV